MLRAVIGRALVTFARMIVFGLRQRITTRRDLPQKRLFLRLRLEAPIRLWQHYTSPQGENAILDFI